MPKRVKADHARIEDAFARLGTIAAAAIEVGVHYNTAAGVIRRLRHVCLDCNTKVKIGERLCEPCRDRQAERARRKRAERLRAGVCKACDEPVAPPSRTLCAKHRLAQIEDNARSDAKRGTSRRGMSSQERREHSIRDNYGAAGVVVWRTSRGRCALCAADYKDVSVQLHHIACDKTNTEENLICLCFKCHRATHQLLGLGNLEQFLRWFHATYPGGQIAPARIDEAA